MRKNSNRDISSFDMLLDTMCNTFGGIVFIALLLAIFSFALGPASNETFENDINHELNRETENLLKEQEQLKTAINYLKSSISLSAMPERGVSKEQLDGYISTNNYLTSLLQGYEHERNRLTSELGVVVQSNAHQTVIISDLQNLIVNMEDKLQSREQDAPRSLRMPRLRTERHKKPVFFAIKDEKFYTISDVSIGYRKNQPRLYDLDSVNVERGEQLVIVECREEAGERIWPGCENSGLLSIALGNLNPSYEYPMFSVFTNSFSHFNYIKSLFVNKGFNYNWVIQSGNSIEIIQVYDVKIQ